MCICKATTFRKCARQESQNKRFMLRFPEPEPGNQGKRVEGSCTKTGQTRPSIMAVILNVLFIVFVYTVLILIEHFLLHRSTMEEDNSLQLCPEIKPRV